MPEIVPWVQAAIALTGLLLASLPQLTSKARLRTRITFWGTQKSEADLEHDRKIAQSLRREASARLLALETYPSSRFLVPLYALAGGLFVAWYLGASIGEKYPESFDYWELSEVDLFLPAAGLFGFLFILSGLTGLGLVRLWRKRVMQDYLRAETITRGKKVIFDDRGSPMRLQEQHGDLKLSIPQGLRTRDTVPTDTPAVQATSCTVGRAIRLSFRK